MNRFLFKIAFISATLFLNIGSFAQETENDTIKGYNTGQIAISNPVSVVEAYSYDPGTDRYILTKTFEGFNINYPIILTPKEYERLVLRESMRDYFQQKTDAIDGKKEGSEAARKDLLPKFYVNSGFFQTVFGGNTIDVKPTGSVEMDLGIRYTKQDNPAFSPRNRAVTTFDFDQRISMSLTGKVGTRLNVNANYDTESTFAFQNLIKLDFAPTEDDIIQKIEVGNVNMPLSSSLIRGAQSLFGVKAQLQFGKTTVTGVFSEQKSQTRTVTSQGGGTIQDFDLFAQEYDADRHFFLTQYFRSRYDRSLRNYPVIDSRVQITRIEVWVTNRQNRITSNNNNLRNIIALQDLGESRLTGLTDSQVVAISSPPANFFTGVGLDIPSENRNNLYNPLLINSGGLLNSNIREIVTSNSGFNTTVSEGTDYAKLENARKLMPNEFTFHPQLGYISLQQRLANDEVLAVAFEYTIGGEVYRVGEFGTDGASPTNVNDAGIPETQTLILKLLKSNLTTVQKPIWNLMMKNIYQIPGAFQLQQEDFKFNILYSDPSPLNYITQSGATPLPQGVLDTPLLKVFNVDKLNFNNDPQEGGDGFFDFIPGLTVDQQNGRLIFTSVEPFGKHLFDRLKSSPSSLENYFDPLTYNSNQSKYVFGSLYSSTQANALQDSEKNKFQLRGRFKSAGGDGIPIGAFNVPQGSVVVTAGGRVLVEGVDYTVNYQAGRVQILDPSLQASNTPIEVSVENNSVFGQQTRRFFGVNVEHKFNENFLIGGTFLKMTERPFTQKSNYGQESVNNAIYGFNTNYSTEVPFLTRLVNKLPNMDTDVPSNVSVRGEIAFLKPDTPRADQFNGESTIYVDDFEGSQTNIDMRAPQSWFLSATPVWTPTSDFPISFGESENPAPYNLNYGYKRAKLSWYTIDPVFYAQQPAGITDEDIAYNSTRRIFSQELYPITDIVQGQSQVINTLDLTYYPTERGPYNFNPTAANTGILPNPEENFGGITRAINSTNFEQSNVEYIQFWMLDPYYDEEFPDQATNPTNIGKLFFNLGEISEDVLKDGRKLYENGLPAALSTQPTIPTLWGKVPAAQSLIYAFDTDITSRATQDVGFDGLTDSEEQSLPGINPGFYAQPDPAADNYQFFLQASGNIFDRYKNYNGLQGNSPIDVADTSRGSTTLPDTEDINRDNTMNTSNAYFEYKIDINSTSLSTPGENYITDVVLRDYVSVIDGGVKKARWVQFKIPIAQPDKVVGGISDFRAIRFMRMFMTGFNDKVTIRFGSLDLVRGEWRRYVNSLEVPADDPDDDNTNFDVQTVNIQENSNRSPIPYVTPPGVLREQLFDNNTLINQNEQSLSLRASGQGIAPGDARAVFKNVSVDMRQFKKLKMFLHAEALQTEPNSIEDNEMVGFIRFGNDFTNNYYQVEIPLKRTAQSARIPEEIWPESNQIDLSLELLTQLKILAMRVANPPEDGVFFDENELNPGASGKINKLRLGIKGNPNFGLVRTLMIGIKNQTNTLIRSNNTINPRNISGEVWFNELRLAEMDNKGGMAAVMTVDSNLADFATISATGRKSTQGFGSLEQGPNERSREDILQYNIVTNLNLGKLLPKKWAINLPFNYSVGEEVITPEYDPFNLDIRLDQLLENTPNAAENSNIRNRAIDYTKRKSINFIGVKKERGEKQNQHFYDPENFTLSYSYNEVERHNFEIESFTDQLVNTAVDYTYGFQSKPIEPFKKSKFFKKSSYWKLLSDFNFNYLPTNISFSTNINRQFNKQQFRLVDVEGIGLESLYRRNFLFNYNYGFNYNLTKNLKLNFNATSNNIVRNYLDENNVPDNSFDVWTDYWNVGTPNLHNQQLTVNYDLPFSKIPFLNFVKSSYTYVGDFSWQRASLAAASFETEDGAIFDLGNTVQNAGSHRLNTTLNMDSFYKYIGLTKQKKAPKAADTKTPKPGEKITPTKGQVAKDRGVFVETMIGFLTSVKSIQLDYTENKGTVLPGYLPSIGFFGTARPSLGFAFGSQDEVRYEAAKNGWLTSFPDFNQNFTQVVNKTLNFRATMDILPDFRIELNGNRTFADNFSEQYDVSSDGQYNSRSPYNFGNFAVSTVMLKTAFKTSDEFSSSSFDDFRHNRIVIANRLAIERGIDITNPSNLDLEGYPLGFGKNSQAVLVPAFLAAYTGFTSGGIGVDAEKISFNPFRNIPIPNWDIKYTGLMKLGFFKERFKRFSIQHNYKASYTINAFRSNFEYNLNPNGLDTGGNFNNELIIGNINLVEQFNPLVRLDFEMKNSVRINAEMKKDRALSMSFDNNLLTEVQGLEYVIAFGYRIKDVVFTSKLADTPTGVIKSDINFKVDFSYRNNKTIVRYLDYNNNQLGGGQNIWSARLSADYSFSKNLTAIFYYDHMFSQAVISTSFPMTNIRSGFTIRYNFGN